jgi:outer membrane protein assembly factor BamA
MEGMRPGRAKRRSDVILFADFEHRRFPQERFWGLGPDSDKDNRSNYRINASSFSVIGGYKFSRWIAAAAGVGFLRVDLGEGTDDRFPTTQELFDDKTAPGLDRQPDFMRYASVLYFNYQDAPGNPHKGGIIGLFYFRYDEIGGNEFDFNRFALDARHYIPLGSKQRTLALRLVSLKDLPDSGSRVPFYLMNTLGGGQTLRGFHDFRFRDANLLQVSAEYRWEPAPALEFALFYDTGKVYGPDNRFNSRNFKSNFGGGIRIKTPTGTFLRLDISGGGEETRLQFAFGPPF